MKVLVDGKDLDLRSEATKAEILAEIRSDCAARGQVFDSLLVDGVALNEEAFLSLEGGSLVEVSTIPLRDLIKSSLEEAVRYLPRLIAGLRSVADSLEASEKTQALSILSDALEGVGWIIRIIADSHALLGARPDEGEILAGLLGDLQERLETLAQSLEEDRPFEAALQIREEIIPALEGLEPRVVALQSLSQGTIN